MLMVPKAFISVKHIQRGSEWMMRASWAVAHFYCCKGFWVIIFVYRQWSSNPEKIDLFPALLWIYTIPPAFTPSCYFIHVWFLFLPWNTKGDDRQNVQAALLHTVNAYSDQGCQAAKHFFIIKIFNVLCVLYLKSTATLALCETHTYISVLYFNILKIKFISVIAKLNYQSPLL